MTVAPAPNFAHLLAMTDTRGTVEHACFAQPRPAHGYCTDDMARVLVVTTREHDPTPQVHGLAGRASRFLGEAQSRSGACRKRMNRNGKLAESRNRLSEVTREGKPVDR